MEAAFGVPAVDPGRPVAPGIRSHVHPQGLVGFLECDCPGLTGVDDAVLRDAVGHVQQRAGGPLSQRVHVAWYLLSAVDADVNEVQLASIRQLADVMPTLVVLTGVRADPAGRPTQADVRRGRYLESVLHPDLPEVQVRLVNARAGAVGGAVVPVVGVSELVAATFGAAPEASRRLRATAEAMARQQRSATSGGLINTAVLWQGTDRVQAGAAILRTAMRQYWSRFRPR